MQAKKSRFVVLLWSGPLAGGSLKGQGLRLPVKYPPRVSCFCWPEPGTTVKEVPSPPVSGGDVG